MSGKGDQSKLITAVTDMTLAREIHRAESDSSFLSVFATAENILRLKREDTGGESSYRVFLQLALQLNYWDDILELIDGFQKGQSKKIFTPSQVEYYVGHFKKKRTRAMYLMVCLRPYVVTHTASWTDEQRRVDVDHPDTGLYFGDWYTDRLTKNQHDGQ